MATISSASSQPNSCAPHRNPSLWSSAVVLVVADRVDIFRKTEKEQLIRRGLAQHGHLVMPGVYDALSAKIASRSGFEVIFITGYSLSATLLGEPDFGLLTQSEVVDAARRICSVVDTPVIVDADTGYGNAVNVIRTVQELIRAAAGGMHIEDQFSLRRCG